MTFGLVHRVLAVVAAVGLLVLAVSGAWLTRYYRPAAVIFGEGRRPASITIAVGAHRAGATVLLLALGVLLGLRLVLRARRAVWPALALLAGIGLVATGRRIAWDLLGLRAVRVNSDIAGMLVAAFDDIVRFVIVDGSELRQTTFRWLLGLHVMVLPLVVVGLLILQRDRDNPAAPGT